MIGGGRPSDMLISFFAERLSVNPTLVRGMVVRANVGELPTIEFDMVDVRAFGDDYQFEPFRRFTIHGVEEKRGEEPS